MSDKTASLCIVDAEQQFHTDPDSIFRSLVEAGLLEVEKLDVKQPIARRPVVRQPVVRQPVVQEPVVRQPVVRQPFSQEPVSRQSVSQEPVVRQPVVRQPVVQEPVVRQPVVRQPVSQEPVSRQSVSQEPVSQEPVVLETVVQEPVSQEPVALETVVQEPVSRQSVSQEPVSQEPVVLEPVSQESVVRQPVVQEPDGGTAVRAIGSRILQRSTLPTTGQRDGEPEECRQPVPKQSLARRDRDHGDAADGDGRLTVSDGSSSSRLRWMSRRAECKNGRHRIREQPGVGAGLRRTVCADCGVVAIGLIDEAAVTSVSLRLRETRIEALGVAVPVNWTS